MTEARDPLAAFVVCGIDGCDFAVERGEGRTMALHQSEDHPEARDPLAAALEGLDEVEQQFLEWDMGQTAAEMHGYLDTLRAALAGRDTPATTAPLDVRLLAMALKAPGVRGHHFESDDGRDGGYAMHSADEIAPLLAAEYEKLSRENT